MCAARGRESREVLARRDRPLTSIMRQQGARSQPDFVSRPRKGPWSLRDAGHSAENFRNNNRLECCRGRNRRG